MKNKLLFIIIVTVSIVALIFLIPEQYEIDKDFGDYRVKYNSNIIDGYEVKGDYELIRIDTSNGEILTKTDSKYSGGTLLSSIPKNVVEPDVDCLWKKMVVFMDEELVDNNYYLRVDDFPIYGWEVRYENGETDIYDTEGNVIGYCTPTPSVAFSMNGPSNLNSDTCSCSWYYHRSIAESYFEEWFGDDTTAICANDGDSMVIQTLSNPDVEYLFEIAHGNDDYFMVGCNGNTNNEERYFAKEDAELCMQNRNYKPIKLSFLANCHALDHPEEDSSIHSILRNHQDTGTASVGYTQMSSSPYWNKADEWEELFYEHFGDGYTTGESYNYASSFYPNVAGNILLVGDTELTLNIEEELEAHFTWRDMDGDGPSTLIEFDATTSVGDIVLYEWDIDNDGTWDYNSGDVVYHNYFDTEEHDVTLRITSSSGGTSII